MNKYMLWIALVPFLISACKETREHTPGVSVTAGPPSTKPATSVPAHPTVSETQTAVSQVPAQPSPTISSTAQNFPQDPSAPIPDDLQVAYILDDTLFLWKGGESQSLVSRPEISSPLLSEDGQWIVFRQNLDFLVRKEDVWAIRADGSGLRRILSPEDLAKLSDTEMRVLIDDLGWLPNSSNLIFTTTLFDEMREGPRIFSASDLYLLDLSGRITQLAAPGLGGKFTPSPDGRYIAVATRSQIDVLNLEAGIRRTLLAFDYLRMGCDCMHIPDLVWDPMSSFVMTVIPSPYIYYPEDFSGEPEQIWRLSVSGPAELVEEVAPTLFRQNAVSLAPDFQRYFYYDGDSCSEGDFGAIYIRSLVSSEGDRMLFCAKFHPEWFPDGEHFLYFRDGHWRSGSVNTDEDQVLHFLDLAAENADWSPALTWINEAYFLLSIRSLEASSLSLGTMKGVLTQIFQAPSDTWPQYSFTWQQ